MASDLIQLQAELDDARRVVRSLIIMGMSPGLTLKDAILIKGLERLARAEVKLRIKALKHAKSQRTELI